MRHCLAVAMLSAACGDSTESSGVPEAATTQQSAGFVQASVEPSFNGGFEDRYMGNCYTVSGSLACEVPVQPSYGWTIRSPGVLWEGIYFSYGGGREPLPPRVGHGTVPDGTSLAFYECDPTGSLRREQDGCIGSETVDSPVFGVTTEGAYRLSIWAKWEPRFVYTRQHHHKSITVDVTWRAPGGGAVGTSALQFSLAGHPYRTWQQFGVDVSVPAGATLGQVSIAASRNSTTNVHLDDVRLEAK